MTLYCNAYLYFLIFYDEYEYLAMSWNFFFFFNGKQLHAPVQSCYFLFRGTQNSVHAWKHQKSCL